MECAGDIKRTKNSTKLVTSAVATVGALLLVALMCFWGCFLYKKFGKGDVSGPAMDISGGISKYLVVSINVLTFTGHSYWR